MKILLVGATGVLGRSVHEVLRERGHEVITASRKESQLVVDITDPGSIQAMYEQAGRVDGVAVAAGSVPWKPFGELTSEDVWSGLAGKLASQVELVRQGSAVASEDASFTLITGVLARDYLVTGTVASLVNGAIENFVRAAAIELPHRQRINVVSPTVFTEAMDDHGDLFRGYEPVPVRRAALAYVRSIEGHRTGQVYVID